MSNDNIHSYGIAAKNPADHKALVNAAKAIGARLDGHRSKERAAIERDEISKVSNVEMRIYANA